MWVYHCFIQVVRYFIFERFVVSLICIEHHLGIEFDGFGVRDLQEDSCTLFRSL